MQQLTAREEQTWEDADTEGAVYCRNIQKKFIEEHLVPWIPVFCEKVIQRAELPFYKEIAALTRKFIEFEQVEINRQHDG